MPTGIAKSYDLVQGVMLDIEDLFHLLSPTDTPLTGGIGADSRSVLPQGTCFEVKAEWQHEALLLPQTTAAAQFSNAATSITVATGEGIRISGGDILLVDNEYIRVTSVATDVLTVAAAPNGRGYGGSTATTHITGSTILVLGQALVEGSNPETARWIDRTGDFNYTQIFGPTAIEISGTENVVKKYGLGGETEFQHQVANRTKEHWIQLERAILYGIRNQDATNKWRSMGGLAYYITTANGSVLDTTTSSFTESSLLAMLQQLYDNGGSPDRAIMGSKNKRLAGGFVGSGVLASGTLAMQEDRTSRERGLVVDFYDSDFGRLSLILDRWCRTADLFVFEREQAQLATLRPLVFEMLAKTGDALRGQILCEKTFKFRRYSHAGRYTVLT